MKSIFTSLALLLALGSSSAFAADGAARTDMGVLGGFRMNDATSDATGTSIDGKGAFQVGGLAFLPFTGALSIRTGFVYAQRNFESKTAGVKSDIELAHFDIPLTVMYNITDMGGIFAGTGIGLKIKDDCGSIDCEGVKSVIVPVQFGGHFLIAPQFAAEVYYETIPGKIIDGIKDASAVVVNAVLTFE